MKPTVLIALNLGLIGLFIFVLRKPGLVSYYHGGRWWLTWLSIAVLTLMDALSSVFYAPAEAYRFIGPSTIFFVAFTSLFIQYLSTRMVEISEILEYHQIIGGGVYSFSYLVLGPMVSFVAVSSIMVDYILTACISAVSAVLNSISFFPGLAQSHSLTIGLVLAIIWGIAGLNILGIKENAGFTFMIFILAAVVFLNLITSGVMSLDGEAVVRLKSSMADTKTSLSGGSWTQGYGNFISHVAFCILAYSGVESVLQTAGLVRNWREIKKAYVFLALTVGIVTPVVAALALSSPMNYKEHEGDLITHYATIINGVPFGVVVAALASFVLIMAVNTAFVASSELLERVAHRYGFNWLIATNRRQSLYRIHLINAAVFTSIIFITQGSQMILADMYAIGLVASFCINIGSLFIYRYFMGTKEVTHYSTSRLGTLIIFIILISCFIFLALAKPHGTLMWAIVSGVVLVAGFLVARKRAPERQEIAKADSEMEMIISLAQSLDQESSLIFRRPMEVEPDKVKDNEVYVTFYSPRQGIPPKLVSNHYRFPLVKIGLYQRIVALLKVVEYELSDRKITVHFGWPMSSWIDRVAIGVMIFKLMRLPRLFPQFRFVIIYPGKSDAHEPLPAG
ncbi:MAG: amino acid permease [Deltaproteobacteria bacterium]|nr:amino acid permease [Deltaproteobacteria bacterium]